MRCAQSLPCRFAALLCLSFALPADGYNGIVSASVTADGNVLISENTGAEEEDQRRSGKGGGRYIKDYRRRVYYDRKHEGVTRRRRRYTFGDAPRDFNRRRGPAYETVATTTTSPMKPMPIPSAVPLSCDKLSGHKHPPEQWPEECPCNPGACRSTWHCFQVHVDAAAGDARMACENVLSAIIDPNHPLERPLHVRMPDKDCCEAVLSPCAEWQPECYANFTRAWFPEDGTVGLADVGGAVSTNETEASLESTEGNGTGAKVIRRELIQRTHHKGADTEEDGKMNSLAQVSMDNSLEGKCA